MGCWALASILRGATADTPPATDSAATPGRVSSVHTALTAITNGVWGIPVRRLRERLSSSRKKRICSSHCDRTVKSCAAEIFRPPACVAPSSRGVHAFLYVVTPASLPFICGSRSAVGPGPGERCRRHFLLRRRGVALLGWRVRRRPRARDEAAAPADAVEQQRGAVDGAGAQAARPSLRWTCALSRLNRFRMNCHQTRRGEPPHCSFFLPCRIRFVVAARLWLAQWEYI